MLKFEKSVILFNNSITCGSEYEVSFSSNISDVHK